MDEECPRSSFDCDGNYSYPIGANPLLAIPAVLSSTLSCVSTVIIVFTYCRWKDIRSGSRAIITFLSIADFITAFGYIMGSLNYGINYSDSHSESCRLFTGFCKVQSFITTSSSLSSFFWTSSLAIYLYLSVVHNRVSFAQKLFPFFHVVNWGLPILICLPLLATGRLGYSYFAVSTWCFVGPLGKTFRGEDVFLVMIAGKFWEILTYVVVVVLYILIKRHINVEAKKGISSKSLNSGLVAILRRTDKKLVAIPVVFVLLRMWGTLHYLYSLAVVHHTLQGCTTRILGAVFTTFAVLQAIGDGGQGWGNFILYVMVSDKIRTRLLAGCCKKRNRGNPHPHNQLQDRSPSFTQDAGGDDTINYGSVKRPPTNHHHQVEAPPNATPTNHQWKLDSHEATTT